VETVFLELRCLLIMLQCPIVVTEFINWKLTLKCKNTSETKQRLIHNVTNP